MSAKTALYDTPEAAQTAFYEALEQGDADQMMLVWADDEDITCVHPTGVRLQGTAAVQGSWEAVFKAARIRVEVECTVRWQSGVIAIHLLNETLFVGDDPSPQGPLHITHVLARGEHGWRLISRHASTTDGVHQAMADARPQTLH